MTLIYAGYAGSKLYNLQTPESDEDVRGVFIEPSDIFFGLTPFDHYRDDDSDTELYGLRKFMGLAIKNNPNILDLIFSPPRMWITATSEWQAIHNIRHSIISHKAISAYKGFIYQEYEKWLKNNTPRQYLVEQYGYDGKMISHVMRLIYQASDIRHHGTYTPVLTGWGRNVVYSMKTNQANRDDIIQVVEGWLQDWRITAPGLLLEPDYDTINNTTIQLYKNTYVG